MLQELAPDPVAYARPRVEQTASLSGKVALMTGSASGTGRGVALPVDGGWTAR
jgi:hypothetical protein